MNRELVIVWLASLTEKQFVDLFYEAVANHNTADVPGEVGHFVLANTCWTLESKRETDFLALPDRDEYPEEWADDCPICQAGSCRSCGAHVRSIAKHAICPICAGKVYCT